MVLFIALSLILLLIWQAWEREHAGAPTVATAPTSSAPSASNAPSVPSAPASPSTAPAAAPATLASAGSITVQTDVVRADIDLLGGDLRRLYLLDYPIDVQHKNRPYELMRDQSPTDEFVVQSGLVGNDATYPTHKSVYRAAATRYALAPDQNSVSVPLSWSQGPIRVTKTYTFHRNSYVIDVRYRIENDDRVPHTAYLYGQFLRSYIAPGGFFHTAPSYIGGAIYTPEKKYEKVTFPELSKEKFARDTKDGWVAMLQHYFVGAWLPPAGSHQFYGESLGQDRYTLGYKDLTPVRVDPGKQATLAARLYAGPKEQARLKAAAPGLDLTVDYGLLTPIAAPLYWIMDQIHALVRNWGVTIILLTVLIKLVFFPLSAASYKSMAHMRKVQPRMAAIRERHANDRPRMNEALMELYRTEKINPLGGCLPIVVQIPVFISLYWVLLESVELRQAPFILWIKDLSIPDPYFVLPILMGGTMFIQQWLNPQPVDPVQQKVMMIMPIAFTVFFLFFPAGLVLYWLVNNVLSIAQQWWIMRRLGATPR